ncbi:MAG: HlyD family efflux transporter periplasmic adaptor subunit [Planctomycetaceae bacterium]
MRIHFLTAAMLLATTSVAQEPDRWTSSQAIAAQTPRIEIRDTLEISVDIPGTLKEVVRVGDIIRKGDLVVRLNDSLVRGELSVIEAQYNEAKAAAESDVLVEFAKVKHATAQVELQVRLEANQKVEKLGRAPVFTATEINRAELDVKQGDAEIRKAMHDRKIAGLAADTKSVEIEAKQRELEQYTVHSEIDGIVTDVVHPAGESVRQGDPILTIVNIDVVKAIVHVDEVHKSRFKVGDTVLVRFNHDTNLSQRSDGRDADSFFTDRPKSDADTRPEATLTSSKPDADDVTFEGTVVLISPELTTNKLLEVTAHIQNRKDSEGRPLLRDGQPVRAVILGD